MFDEYTSQGLIVSTSAEATPALGELVVCCGWPVLLRATPRQLRSELVQRAPNCSLFWLDDARDVTPTTRLLAWLGASQPKMARIAVAYQLAPEVELAIRSANVHFYLDAGRNIRALVEDWMPRWLAVGQRRAPSSIRRTSAAQAFDQKSGPRPATLHLREPP